MKKLADEVFKQVGMDKDLEIALELERIALSDDYFVSRKLYPNVDFYTGLIYRSMAFPTDFFTVLFAVARTAGWLAQWEEMLNDKEQKIARPRQIYVGYGERPYESKLDHSVTASPGRTPSGSSSHAPLPGSPVHAGRRQLTPARVRTFAAHRTDFAPRHARRAHQRAELHQRLVVRPRRAAGAGQDGARDRPDAPSARASTSGRRPARTRA